MAASPPSTESVKELFSASTNRIEPLPKSASIIEQEGQEHQQSLKDEKEWLDAMIERADRENGLSDVQFTVGQHYFERHEYVKALKYFEKAARVGGDRQAQSDAAGDKNKSSQAKYQLAVMYYDGLGVKEDPEKGSLFMRQLAESKVKKDANIIPSAQYNLGRAYFMGFGVPQSDSEAERWWLSAASLGTDSSSIRAKNTLALFYSRKDSSDTRKCFRWHMEAAEGGNLESMAAVGAMLLQGQGCAKNTEEGLSWLKKSAEGGCIYGEGVLSRQYLAMKLFSKAAETAFRACDIEHPAASSSSDESMTTSHTSVALSKWDCMGVAMACFVFGRCLQLGNAVVKNEAKAMEYYQKAKKFDMAVVADMHTQLLHNQL